MPAVDWTGILSGIDAPAGLLIVAFLASNVLSFFLARGTSKDKVNSAMLEQTVKRQQELDVRQGKMMDDLQEEFGRVRNDMSQIRQELSDERKRFNALSEKYSTLVAENFHLRQLVKNHTSEKTQLEELIEGLKVKNRELTDQLFQSSQAIEYGGEES